MPEDKRGDDFATFYEARHRSAFRLALLLTGGERPLAEDAVSEAFASVYPKWLRGSVQNPDAYLRRAVMNQLKTSLRRRQRERQRDATPATIAGQSDADQAIVDRDALWRALRALPPRQRAAVVLRYFADLSEAETARELGTSVGTVKAHVSRGLQRMRLLMECEHDG